MRVHLWMRRRLMLHRALRPQGHCKRWSRKESVTEASYTEYLAENRDNVLDRSSVQPSRTHVARVIGDGRPLPRLLSFHHHIDPRKMATSLSLPGYLSETHEKEATCLVKQTRRRPFHRVCIRFLFRMVSCAQTHSLISPSKRLVQGARVDGFAVLRR